MIIITVSCVSITVEVIVSYRSTSIICVHQICVLCVNGVAKYAKYFVICQLHIRYNSNMSNMLYKHTVQVVCDLQKCCSWV